MFKVSWDVWGGVRDVWGTVLGGFCIQILLKTIVSSKLVAMKSVFDQKLELLSFKPPGLVEPIRVLKSGDKINTPVSK